MRKTVLVLSTGRTGTKWLAEYFASYEEVSSHHTSKNTPLINILSNMVLSRCLPLIFLDKVWENLKGRELEGVSEDIYLDSNNHLYAFPYLSPASYKNLHVVHVVRDVRTYVKSHMSLARDRKKSFFANYILPFWQPNGWLTKKMSVLSWLRISRISRFIWIWSYKNQMIEQSKYVARGYLRVRFEDLFGEDGDLVLSEICDFVGVESLKGSASIRQKKNYSSGSVGGIGDWSKKDVVFCDIFCAEQMRNYGYSQVVNDE